MSNRVTGWIAGALGTAAAVAFGTAIVSSAIASSDRMEYGGSSDSFVERGADASGTTLPMEDILAKLKAQGYGDIYEIERERGAYKIEARDTEGRKIELYVDSKSGKLIRQEMDD